MVTWLENALDSCCQKRLGLSPDLQYVSFRALRWQWQRGYVRKYEVWVWSQLKNLCEFHCHYLHLALKSSFWQNWLFCIALLFIFKMQILNLACLFILRALWAHPLLALFYVVCYLPLCCAHCGSKDGSLLNCRALPHGMCFWAGFCAGWQWHWTLAVGKT